MYAFALANFAIYVGAGQGALAVFAKALVAQLNYSRGSVGLVGTLILLTPVALSLVFGSLSDRGHAPRIAVAGHLSTIAGFALAASSQRLGVLYAFSVCMGFAQAALGLITASAIASSTSPTRRGISMGIATMGISLGGIFGPSTVQTLIDRYGLSTTYLCGALFGLATLPVTLSSMRRVAHSASARPNEHAAPMTRLLTTRTFWALVAINTGMLYTVYAISQSWVLALTDAGRSTAVAARMLTLYYACGLVGRFAIGAAFDRFNRNTVARAQTALMAGFVIVLALLGATPVATGLYAIGFGFLYGGFLIVVPLLIHQSFPAHLAGRILGACAATWGVLSALSPYVTGVLHDRTGTYRAAFALAALMASFAALATWFVRKEIET